MVFSAFLLGAQHNRVSVENKPASLLAMSLGKTLNGLPPSLCGRQVAGQAVFPSWWPSLTKDMHMEHELTRTNKARDKLGRQAVAMHTSP